MVRLLRLLRRMARRERARFRLYARRGMSSVMALEYAAAVALPALVLAKVFGAF